MAAAHVGTDSVPLWGRHHQQ